MCGGKKCCLTCSRAKDSYSPCDRMCSKAQAARKEKRDEAKAQADARAREAAKGYQATTQERAQRLLRAIDAAGLPDDSKFAWRYYWKPIRVSDLRRWAAGEFNEEEDLWTCAELDPERIESPVALAQLFGCTTDYLLGLSDELTAGAAPENPTSEGEASVEPAAPPPAEEASADPKEGCGPAEETELVSWRTGFPSRSCKVYAKFGPIGDDQFFSQMVVYYDSVLKLFHFGRLDRKVEYPCVGWVPLPED